MNIVMKPVEMIATFSTKGELKPIRFRMENQDGQRVIQIERILFSFEDKCSGDLYLTYRCQGIFQGILKDFELLYNKSTFKWTLLKI